MAHWSYSRPLRWHLLADAPACKIVRISIKLYWQESRLGIHGFDIHDYRCLDLFLKVPDIWSFEISWRRSWNGEQSVRGFASLMHTIQLTNGPCWALGIILLSGMLTLPKWQKLSLHGVNVLSSEVKKSLWKLQRITSVSIGNSNSDISIYTKNLKGTETFFTWTRPYWFSLSSSHFTDRDT